MSLATGDRLGPYEILAPIGAGGMGEIYRARDTKLDREVAIKVLPAALAQHPDRLARFEREAKVLAALNHPNIAIIHGLEDRAIVMELVEGPTLADRLRTGPIPLEESLKIAAQIADALEVAHEKGIVHRDLKPANVKVRDDGTVKVLDFGLATAVQSGAGQPPDGANSPTLTMAATEAGVILGTAAYMSPEQAAGKPVDRRADIWSFGVVLWEMLTGKRLFEGETVSHTLADVLKGEINFGKLPKGTPEPILELLQRCLDQDVKTRLQWIGEARIAIQKWITNPNWKTTPIRTKPGWVSWAGWGAAAAIAVVLGSAWLLALRQIPMERPRVRYQIVSPENSQFAAFTLSPNGRYLAYVTIETGNSGRLWLRQLDSLQSHMIDGADAAVSPFWSPDSEHIGFFARGKLYTVSKEGGSPIALSDAPTGVGNNLSGTWTTENNILFTAYGNLFRVSSAGGMPVRLVLAPNINAPAALPNGKFLFSNAGGIWVGSQNGGQLIRILPDRTNAEYVGPMKSGDTGFLLLARGNTLMAQPFDGAKGQTRGEIFPVADGVGTLANGRRGAFSVSANGVLVYGHGSTAQREVVWVDRTGKKLESATKPFVLAVNPAIALSPDDSKIAIPVGMPPDIWVVDLKRETFSRFTFAGSSNAVWSPDNKELMYQDSSSRQYRLKAVDGSGSDESLFSIPTGGYLYDWSPDGKFVAFTVGASDTLFDIWLVSTDNFHKPYPYRQSRFNETWARFSPDSRWMAYTSDESGQQEIYVESIPAGRGRWQISTEGGQWPRWRSDGKELFYRQGNKMMAVPMRLTASAVEAGKPEVLFESNDEIRFQVTRDGQRFLLTYPPQGVNTSDPLTVDTNWRAALKK